MMSVYVLNLNVRQGSTADFTIPVLSDSVALDLTGASVRSQVRQWYGGPLLVDLAPYLTISNAVGGVLRLVIPAAITAAFQAQKGSTPEAAQLAYVWDCEMVEVGGAITPLWEGSFTVQAEVTT